MVQRYAVVCPVSLIDGTKHAGYCFKIDLRQAALSSFKDRGLFKGNEVRLLFFLEGLRA